MDPAPAVKRLDRGAADAGPDRGIRPGTGFPGRIPATRTWGGRPGGGATPSWGASMESMVTALDPSIRRHRLSVADVERMVAAGILDDDAPVELLDDCPVRELLP